MATTKTKIVIILSVLVGIVLLVNVFLLTDLSGLVNEQGQKAMEAAIPANLELTVLTSASCSECFDSAAIISQFSGANVTSQKKIEFDSDEGKALILKYNISKIPSVIVSGETNKSTKISTFLAQAGKDYGDAFVIESPIPPFVDAHSGEVRGLVRLTVITDDACTDCYNMTPLIVQLNSTLAVKESHVYDYTDSEARALIAKYDIDAVPTLLFDSEASVYPMISEVWPMVGSIEKDGTYVMRNLNPPYYNLTTRKVEGMVSMKVLVDKTCTTCYNATKINTAILSQLGVKLQATTEVDVSSLEGKALIDEYNISLVPTILLVGDMVKYPNLGTSWKSVGSIEKDGTYILRKIDVFKQPYMDLEAGRLVTPTSLSAVSETPSTSPPVENLTTDNESSVLPVTSNDSSSVQVES